LRLPAFALTACARSSAIRRSSSDDDARPVVNAGTPVLRGRDLLEVGELAERLGPVVYELPGAKAALLQSLPYAPAAPPGTTNRLFRPAGAIKKRSGDGGDKQKANNDKAQKKLQNNTKKVVFTKTLAKSEWDNQTNRCFLHSPAPVE
jgi:hypothetical protein